MLGFVHFSSSATYCTVVAFGTYYFSSHHSPHEDLKTSSSPIVLVFTSRYCRCYAKYSRLGARQKLCLQLREGTRQSLCNLTCPSSLPPSLPKPRIVNDHVLEETPPCPWVLRAKRKRSRVGGTCMRPNCKVHRKLQRQRV